MILLLLLSLGCMPKTPPKPAPIDLGYRVWAVEAQQVDGEHVAPPIVLQFGPLSDDRRDVPDLPTGIRFFIDEEPEVRRKRPGSHFGETSCDRSLAAPEGPVDCGYAHAAEGYTRTLRITAGEGDTLVVEREGNLWIRPEPKRSTLERTSAVRVALGLFGRDSGARSAETEWMGGLLPRPGELFPPDLVEARIADRGLDPATLPIDAGICMSDRELKAALTILHAETMEQAESLARTLLDEAVEACLADLLPREGASGP